MTLRSALRRPNLPSTAVRPLERSIVYLTLQAMSDGRAAHAHVMGIVHGLRNEGWRVDVVGPTHDVADPSIWARFVHLARTQGRALRAIGRARLVYVRWHWASLPFVLGAKVRGCRIVLEVNGTHDDFLTSWRVPAPLAWLIVSAADVQLRLADGVIAVTQGLGAWVHRRASGRPVEVVPNGVDTDVFRPIDAPELDTPYVLFVGALASWQGIDEMLEATEEPTWPDGLKLMIVGDGALRARCEAWASERVDYVGRKPHAEIPGLLARAVASLSVQTPVAGRGEVGCSPIKLYEGLAAGRPLIVSDLPGVREVVEEDRCGLVVPTGDPAALARAVATLAGDVELADEMGRRGHEAAVRQHSWRARARATSSFIDRVQRR